MAAPAPFESHQVVVKATISSTLTVIGALTTRGLSFNVETSSPTLPRDTASVTTTPTKRQIATAKTATMSGEGLFYKAYQDAVDDLLGVVVAWQFILPGAGAVGGGTWEGDFMLTTFDITGQDGEFVTASFSCESSDEMPTFTATA